MAIYVQYFYVFKQKPSKYIFLVKATLKKKKEKKKKNLSLNKLSSINKHYTRTLTFKGLAYSHETPTACLCFLKHVSSARLDAAQAWAQPAPFTSGETALTTTLLLCMKTKMHECKHEYLLTFSKSVNTETSKTSEFNFIFFYIHSCLEMRENYSVNNRKILTSFFI